MYISQPKPNASGRPSGTATARDAARDWLNGRLSIGPVPIQQTREYVEAHQDELNFSWDTLLRAKRDIPGIWNHKIDGVQCWDKSKPSTATEIEGKDQSWLLREKARVVSNIQEQQQYLAELDRRLQAFGSEVDKTEEDPEPESLSPTQTLARIANAIWTDVRAEHHRLAYVKQELFKVRDKLKRTDEGFASIPDGIIHGLATQPLVDADDFYVEGWLADKDTVHDMIEAYESLVPATKLFEPNNARRIRIESRLERARAKAA